MGHGSNTGLPRAEDRISWDEARALVLRELRDIVKDVDGASAELRQISDRLQASDLSIQGLTSRIEALEGQIATAIHRLDALDTPETGSVSRNRHKLRNLETALSLDPPEGFTARLRDRAANVGVKGAGIGAGAGAGGVLVWQLVELFKSLSAGG